MAVAKIIANAPALPAMKTLLGRRAASPTSNVTLTRAT